MVIGPFGGMRRRIMVRRTITIELESGLEARPVAMLVQVASQYDSSIYVECDSRRVNAKSIMGMMTLGLTAGEQVVVTANGADEEKAVDGIARYLTEG
jgi:catabolite repression HPr-like protein